MDVDHTPTDCKTLLFVLGEARAKFWRLRVLEAPGPSLGLRLL